MEQLYRLVTNWFVAGLITNEKGIVIRSAPILKWTIGKHINEVLKWKKLKEWQKL